MQYEIKNLGGVQCIFAPMKDSNSTTIQILVKAGSLYETRETNGLSHFLEHMFFKGGKKHPLKGDISNALDEIGADYNAFTGTEYAGYYVKSAPEYFAKSFDILSDVLVNATFDPAEIELEKGVIVEEQKRKNDNPNGRLYTTWTKNYYGDNVYGWEVLGTKDNVLSFSQEDFFNHKKNLYTKDNLIVVVAGKIVDQQAIEDMIGNTLVHLPEKASVLLPSYNAQHPIGKTDMIPHNIEQHLIRFGSPGYKRTDELYYHYNILANLAGGTWSSRIYQEVREKRGLAYSIYYSHRTFSDHGIFTLVGGMAKEKSEEGMKVIKDILADIANGNITEEELEKAKKNRVGALQMGVETSDEMADFLGFQHLLDGKIETVEDQIHNFKNVDLETVKKIAKAVHPDNLYGCIMG